MQRHPDFRLTVWYHGLKATQYFTKFTPESIAVLKKDLTVLGLPQPKNQNISLLSHGAVECCWPSGRMNPVLHQNLMAKTDPTPTFHATLNQLSILNITVKETSASYAPIIEPDLVKPTSLKRPYYEQRVPASVPVVSTGQLADTSRGQQTLHKLRKPSASGYRPHLDHQSAGPGLLYPSDDSPRPNKLAKTHAQVFQLSAKSVNNGSSGPINRSQAATPTTPAIKPWSPRRPATNSASNMNIRTPSNRGSIVAGVGETVDAFLNNLELQSTIADREPPRKSVPLPPKPVSLNDTRNIHNVCYPPNNGSAPSHIRIESQGPTAAVDSDRVGQAPGRNIPKPRAIKAPSISTSSFDSHFRLNLGSAPFPTPVVPSHDSVRLGSLAVPKMTADQGNTVPPTPPSVNTKDTGSSSVQPVATNDTTQQVVKSLRARGIEAQTVTEWWSEQGGALLKHFVLGTDDSHDREKTPKLESVIKELNLVKKELEEERRSRKEDKELLGVERRRREEAEHALADVRRECRQPFVVPSLLDAFVELSKLATRGLKVSGSKVLANPAGYPSTQDRRDDENISRADVNGHGTSSPGEASSPPLGAQRTKLKLEPSDYTVTF